MMKTSQQFAFRVAAAYLKDQQAQGLKIPEEMLNNLLGSLRARNISAVATASQQLTHEYHGEPLFFSLRQFEAFFKKNEAFSTPKCDEAALIAFRRYEKRCLITNKRVSFYEEHPDRLNPVFRAQIKRMQHFIREVLGEFYVKGNSGPSGFLCDLPSYVKLTNGATKDSQRCDSEIWKKLSVTPQGPLKAKPYVEALLRYYGFSKLPNYRVTPFNRVAIVPKNWKTGRTIGMEACAAMPLQLAFDNYVKSRLKRGILGCYIDLGDQSSNQLAAFKGSLDGSIATIDLEGASDCLAYDTAALLLPAEWFKYLNDIRACFWLIESKGKPRQFGKFQKLSSMGNGSTFPIETLIFAAACYACGSDNYRVYGDDIALETQNASNVISLLRHLGFRTNLDKTFTTGLFRESCGADYIQGRNVTPFYLRSAFSDDLRVQEKTYKRLVETYTERYGSMRNARYRIRNGSEPDLKPELAKLFLKGPRAPLNDMAVLCHHINGLLKLNNGYVGDLLAFCCETIRQYNLPFVPLNGDSRSGVWLHAYHAYKLGVLRYCSDNIESKTSYQNISYRSINVTPKRLTVNRGYGVYMSWFLLKSEPVFDQRVDLNIPEVWKPKGFEGLRTARIATVVDDPNKLSTRMGSTTWVPNPQDDYTERLFIVSESLIAALQL